jgi:proteasome accessory factor A
MSDGGGGTEIESKIRGVEQEYPVSAKAALNPSLLVNAAIYGLRRRRFSKGIKWDLSTEISQEAHESRIESSFGDNGCRIYNDLGHLEISSPSYNNPFDAVAYDKASEIYAFVGSREASLSLKNKVLIHKNNVANFFRGVERKVKSNTYATHGNIILKREACKRWPRVEKALIPWVITRILFMGSGDVVSAESIGKEGAKFVISPRAMFVFQKSSHSTTTGRGILNTRDQPHSSFKYWRLHDIHYEALRSEYAIFLRDIAQAMVIRAFELGHLDDAPEIEDPVKAFKEISADTQECNWKIKLKNGEMTDAVSILQFYLAGIEKMYEVTEEGEGPEKWDEIGLKGLKEVFGKLEERRIEEYIDGIDWVTKLALLVNYEPKNISEGISICNQYALLDESVMYCVGERKEDDKLSCLFNPKESQAFAKKELPNVNWSSMLDRIKYALNNAPEQTRDFFRTEMMKRYGSYVRSVSWSTMVLNEGKILLDEPFMLNKKEIGNEMSEGKELKEILLIAKRLYPDKIIL